MKYVRAFRFVTSSLLILWLTAGAALAAGPKPVEQAFKLSVFLGEEEGLELQWSIEPGYYLYRDKLAATLNGRRLKLTTGQGELKDDPTFGLTEIFRRTATAAIDGDVLPEHGELRITYQGCGEGTICYPPVTKAIDLATLVVSDVEEGAGRKESFDGDSISVSSGLVVADEADSAGVPSLEGGYASTLLAFLGLGVLLAFTPCVFPMLPILSGMLTQSAGRLSLERSFALSATYVVAMAAAYAALGIFAAWFGGNLQATLQTPLAVGLMSAVFVLLALSMFGLYELQLPQALLSKLSPGAGEAGSVPGAALLGFTSALIVGPCVTPPLAAALIYVAQTGDSLRGASALFALGLGMGLPLLLFGTFGASALPKSGPWLIRIKQAFGIIFVGLAIWMESRVLPLSWIAAAWGAFLIGAGCWLGLPGLMSTKPGWSWRRRAQCVAGCAFAIYGGLLIHGAIGSRYELLQPLALAGIVPPANAIGLERDNFLVVTSEADLDAAIANGRDASRPILVDFSADWCTECRLMERTVFADAAVREKLSNLLLIRADMTHYDARSKRLMQRFAIVGPPTIVFLSPAGAEIGGTRIVGATAVGDFLYKIAAAERG